MPADYLPRKDAQFLQWVVNFIRYLTVAAERFGFPADILQQLSAKMNDFVQKFEAASNISTRTKLTVQAKNTARKSLEQDVRQLVKEYLTNNHLVTNEDRDGLGLPIYKTTRTPSAVAKTYPAVWIDSSIIRRLIIHFGDQEKNKESKAKPPGQHGVEIRWAILETVPTSLNEFTNSSFKTKTPFVLEFDENQRGKDVYICLCWENTRGEKGPWSDIVKAVIP
jgi:hypothetical protein